MTEKRLKELINKQVSGEASEAEKQELFAFYEALDMGRLMDENDPSATEHINRQYHKFIQKAKQLQRRRKVWQIGMRTAAAAVLIIALGLGWRLWTGKKPLLHPDDLTQHISGQPGRDGAMLQLADGSVIELDSAGYTNILNKDGVHITNKNGQLNYNVTDAAATQISYNKLSTPNGRQYRIVLPDGTKTWLNAASTITYPTAFTGKERVVTITGEVYFEVVHNGAQPFRVKAGDMTVDDIGTHFSVMAYEDEPSVKTTLLEGAASVTKGGSTKILRPGEQAQVQADNSIKVVQLPDAEEAIAWQKGLINLSSADVPELLRQIARWYDVDVEYMGKVPSGRISGTITRNTDLRGVITMLAANGISCRLVGRKLLVSDQ